MVNDICMDPVIDRCLAVAARCVAHQHQWHANAFMKAQFGEIAEEIAPWGLSAEEKALRILRPTREALVSRFGLEAGWSLYRDFIDAFWPRSWADASAANHEFSRMSYSMTDSIHRS